MRRSTTPYRQAVRDESDRLLPRDLGWCRASPGRLAADTGLGVAVGAALAVACFRLLAPVLDLLQRTTGDIVPPGELLPSFRTGLVAFFAANLVVAPLVEESLYRGYALPRLRERWGPVTAVAVSCAFFGVLHWSSGLWNMPATALVAGVPFALLTLWRRSIVAAYAAHLTLNAMEFVVVAVGQRAGTAHRGRLPRGRHRRPRGRPDRAGGAHRAGTDLQGGPMASGRMRTSQDSPPP